MTLKTKKIIAREGLLLLGVVLAYIFVGNILCYKRYCFEVANAIVFLYALFILFRFIYWAIKTLRGK